MLRVASLLVLTAGALVAIAAPRRGLGADPPPLAIEDSTLARARLDSLQKAVWAAEASLEAEPRSSVAWTNLARAWYQAGNTARTQQALDQAVANGGGREFDTLLLLGRASRTRLRLVDAERWGQRATRVRPESAEAHEELGLTFYLEGKYAQAVAEWRQAASLPGASRPAPEGLLIVLERAAKDAYSVTGAGSSRVPFVRRAGASAARSIPTIDVRIHGRGPWPFEVGTGTSELVLGRALAQELKLAVVPGDTSSGRDYALLDSLRIGGYLVRQVPCVISDSPRYADRGLSGTLGLEVLKRFRFCLDYPDRALVLESRPVAAMPDTARPSWVRAGDVAHELPMLLRGTHLILAEGAIQNAPTHPILLEPGLPGVGFAAARSALAEAKVAVTGIAPLTGRLGGSSVSYVPVSARVCVGDACVDDLAGVYGIFPEELERNPEFRIGALVSDGFLSRYRLGVDAAHGRLWLIEPARSP